MGDRFDIHCLCPRNDWVIDVHCNPSGLRKGQYAAVPSPLGVWLGILVNTAQAMKVCYRRLDENSLSAIGCVRYGVFKSGSTGDD